MVPPGKTSVDGSSPGMTPQRTSKLSEDTADAPTAEKPTMDEGEAGSSLSLVSATFTRKNYRPSAGGSLNWLSAITRSVASGTTSTTPVVVPEQSTVTPFFDRGKTSG